MLYIHSKLSAFSLIELVVAISVVGILSLSTIPTYHSYVHKAQVVKPVVISSNVVDAEWGCIASIDLGDGSKVVPATWITPTAHADTNFVTLIYNTYIVYPCKDYMGATVVSA